MDSLRTVLTIDQSAVGRAMIGRYLERHGWQLLEATTASDGVAAARTHEPDVILLDTRTGAGALADLQTDDRCREIPVILLAAPGSERAQAMASTGADGCLVKPFGQHTMDRELAAVLKAPRGVEARS